MKRLQCWGWTLLGIIWFPFEVLFTSLMDNTSKLGMYIYYKLIMSNESNKKHAVDSTPTDDDNSYH